MKSRIIATVFIVIGFVLILYPTGKNAYQSFQQKKLLKEWKESLDAITVDDTVVASDLNLEQNQNTAIGANQTSNEKTKAKTMESKQTYEIEGVLEIPKIEFAQPIITDATSKHLFISVASIKGTGEPGSFGNYGIAGHRSHKYGKNFNRLDELEVGDEIYVTNKKSQKFTYKVVEKLYVSPTDVYVLNSDSEKKEISLVTCHPEINPTQRLIIKGTLVE